VNSTFIYDINEYENYFSKIKDKNRIKLSDKECESLKNIIAKSFLKDDIKNNHSFISVEKNLADDLFNIYKKPIQRSSLELFLIEEYSKTENRTNFTCRKLARKFKEITNENISKSTINNILKNNLGLRWRKTAIKNSKIKRKENIMMSLTFIKIVVRSMIQNFNIIYCDESCIQTINNHPKIWKAPNDDFSADISSKKRFNLIMACNKNGVVHYIIDTQNTTKKSFLEYMKELLDVINKKNIKPYLIVLDNLSVHKTKDLFQFYKDNKINIVFNSPYASKFNAIEYTFRDLKKNLYSKIYSNEEKLLNEIKEILNSKWFNDKVENNIREACSNYLSFYEEQKNINLNNLI
jgi:transposase